MNVVAGVAPTLRTISNVPDGMQPMVLARLVEQRLKDAPDDTEERLRLAFARTTSRLIEMQSREYLATAHSLSDRP